MATGIAQQEINDSRLAGVRHVSRDARSHPVQGLYLGDALHQVLV